MMVDHWADMWAVLTVEHSEVLLVVRWVWNLADNWACQTAACWALSKVVHSADNLDVLMAAQKELLLVVHSVSNSVEQWDAQMAAHSVP